VVTIDENEFRLIMVKGDDAESKVKKNIEKEAQAIVEDINNSILPLILREGPV
jgi:hypothetical protein